MCVCVCVYVCYRSHTLSECDLVIINGYPICDGSMSVQYFPSYASSVA